MPSAPATALPVRGPDNVTIGRRWDAPDGIHVIDDRYGIESVHARLEVAERHCFIRASQTERRVAEVVGEVLDLYVERGLLHVAVDHVGQATEIGEREKQQLARLIERSREIAARVDELLAVIRSEGQAANG
jgi:hypothetical protein